MAETSRGHLTEVGYRRLMLQRAVDLSRKYGGLKRIPASILLENGLEIAGGKSTNTVSIALPSEEVMKKRMAEVKPTQPAIVREFEPFKLPPEPTPRSLTEEPATMEDFWIEQGWYKVDKNGWGLTLAKWAEAGIAVRIKAVRFLVQTVLQKDPRDLTADDFRSNMLKGLLTAYHSNSPFSAITEAFPELDIKPWEMCTAPQGFYMKRENRVAAVRWLVGKLEKNPREITQGDLNRIRGVLPFYSGSPYGAISDAFPELDIKPWEMSTVPHGFYENEENRIRAIRWLVEKLEKNPRDISWRDLSSKGFSSLVDRYYGCSPHKAISAAFPELDIKPWEMRYTPRGFYEEKGNRITAIKWLVEKLGKDPRDITGADFYSNRLVGLIDDYYDDSPYQALLEAGMVTPQDEGHMRKSGPRTPANQRT